MEAAMHSLLHLFFMFCSTLPAGYTAEACSTLTLPLLATIRRFLDQNLFSGTLPSQLGKVSASQACQLNPSQCEASNKQPCTGNQNHFSCPVPQLSASCSKNLTITCSATPPSPPHAASTVAINALRTLYEATSGANWNGNVDGNGNWLVGDPCINSWAGVTCNDAGDITTVYACCGPTASHVRRALRSCAVAYAHRSLGSNNLAGTIPTEVGMLTNLESQL